MFKTAKPVFFRVVSSLHAGSGDALGVVDLPIQREKHTSFPKIESSSLKGSLREAFEENIKGNDDEVKIHLAFGYDSDSASEEVKKKFKDNDEFSGCLGFSDARLLLFPVKSAKGIFAWITCPYILNRFKEDVKIATGKEININNLKVNIGECLVSENSLLKINQNVILEEYSFKTSDSDFKIDEFLNFINLEGLKEKIVILNNDDLKDFVNLSTEVITRTKIDNETGTVSQGALFNEEYLPPETIMYYIVFASPVFQKDNSLKNIFKDENDVIDFFTKDLKEYFQIGGNATLGKGIVKVINKTNNQEGKKNE